MTQKSQKQQVTELLKAIETGAAEPVGYINAITNNTTSPLPMVSQASGLPYKHYLLALPA